jgi:hypothetical protein
MNDLSKIVRRFVNAQPDDEENSFFVILTSQHLFQLEEIFECLSSLLLGMSDLVFFPFVINNRTARF